MAAKKLGFKVGTSMDLTTKDEHGRAWDFTKVEMRNFAYRKVCEEKPFMLIGSPVCTPWSQIMNINYSRMTWEEKERILNAARVHLEFVCKLYRLQHQAGRYFAHEHPQGAASWKEASVREIRRWTGIECLTIDQCMYGLLSKTDLGEQLPARKATTIMTNCPALSVTLNKRCDHGHTHQQLIGGKRTSEAQVYPSGLVDALVEGIRLQMKWDNDSKFLIANFKPELNNLDAKDMERRVPPEEEDSDEYKALWLQAWDDITGQELDTGKVIEARRLEVEYYEKMKVLSRVHRDVCWQKTGRPPLKARWIDHDKGDRYRSRWVAKQFKNMDSDEWFAATPPLEALRAVLSFATTGGIGKGFMVNDVSRAFFYAPVQQDIFVELCDEMRRGPEDDNMVGWLNKSMYGTKAAAQNWQSEVQRTMHELGFVQGRSSSVLFWHPVRRIRALVHGDDFGSSGSVEDLVWFRNKLEEKYEIKSTIIGEAPELKKEVHILNRKVTWHVGKGFSYEADPKRAQTIIDKTGTRDMKPLAVPIVKDQSETEAKKEEDVRRRKAEGKLGAKPKPADEELLDGPQSTMYRGLAATLNYLAADRCDLMYAAKECARLMATPTRAAWDKMVRVGRYLRGKPRVRVWYHYQEEAQAIVTHSDTDWAGCRRTRRSTTGGYTSYGTHLLKAWCRTQATVALSSAEAELYGLVRASAETLGMMSLYQDLGEAPAGQIMGDASAALAIVARRGI